MYVATFSAAQAPADPTPIYANHFTMKIVIGEDPSVANWPTTNYNIWKADPRTGARLGPRQVAIGKEYAFESDTPFQQGQLVGWVQPVTTTTFFQDEIAGGRKVGYGS